MSAGSAPGSAWLRACTGLAHLLRLLWSATELRLAQAEAAAAAAVQIPITYYGSTLAFDECGWTCTAPAGGCDSFEFEWVCTRNEGYDDGGNRLRFTEDHVEVLNMSATILQELTTDVAMYEKLRECVRKSVNFPEVKLYELSDGKSPPEQAADGCSTHSSPECVARAMYDFAHLMWYAASWPPLSILPWYESPANGDNDLPVQTGATAFVSRVQRQIRFVNEAGISDTYAYPQYFQYWDDFVIVNINRFYIDYYSQGGSACWNPTLTGANKWQYCAVDRTITDLSSCKHCAARNYAGAELPCH